MVYKQSFSYVN